MVEERLMSIIANLKINDDEKRQQLLAEIYELVDEYNSFVLEMDKRFDKVVSGLEQVAQHEIS